MAPAEHAARASGACAESSFDYPQIHNLRLGTSSLSCQDWVGVFYPADTAPADFISEYAKHFDTVEVDSTFYRTPSAAMVSRYAYSYWPAEGSGGNSKASTM